jgi:hypothetical protein
MKKKLKRVRSMCYWIDGDGVRQDGIHAGIWGNVSGIRGNVTNLRGDVSGLSGDVSDICGDIDDCDITDDDRAKGVKIADLVE